MAKEVQPCCVLSGGGHAERWGYLFLRRLHFPASFPPCQILIEGGCVMQGHEGGESHLLSMATTQQVVGFGCWCRLAFLELVAFGR